MTLLVHLLQYQLHLSEITDTDTKYTCVMADNDHYQLSIQLSVGASLMNTHNIINSWYMYHNQTIV